MGEIAAPFALAVGAYVLLVIGVGVASTRRAGRSPEEFFLAGRGLGSAVLFMALFGTNCTAFVLVGIPGRAYHDGIGVFGLNAPIVALGIPLSSGPSVSRPAAWRTESGLSRRPSSTRRAWAAGGSGCSCSPSSPSTPCPTW